MSVIVHQLNETTEVASAEDYVRVHLFKTLVNDLAVKDCSNSCPLLLHI